MRVLIIGAGRTGTRVIRQLKKNPEIEIITADPRQELYAVEQGVIDAVNIREALTPLTLEKVLSESRPDLVLLAMPAEDMELGKAPGIDILAEALREELAALAKVPLIEVARGSR
jgi:saccharopine dehydrogenase-like NADP-dependent oxidoreductase